MTFKLLLSPQGKETKSTKQTKTTKPKEDELCVHFWHLYKLFCLDISCQPLQKTNNVSQYI